MKKDINIWSFPQGSIKDNLTLAKKAGFEGVELALILSLFRRERIPGVPVASQEEALSTGKARGTPGSCHHSKSPPDVSVHSRGTGFPCNALTFKPRIDSHHVCTWDSPVGKPRGKASWERHEGKP